MKIKKRYLVPLLLVGTLFLGPRPNYPDLDPEIQDLALSIEEVAPFVQERESKVAHLKPDNEARVIWADSVRQTPYSVVYLHGFSASPMEGDPVHQEFAERYGCNLYLARIADHGLDYGESFANLTPQDMVDSGKEAIAIGKILGEKVILMSCSTGGTLSIYLSAENPEDVHAQILYSPNITLYTSAAKMLTYPWGKQLGLMVEGSHRSLDGMKGEARNYWTTKYRIDGVISLMSLLEKTMTPEIFAKVNQPLMMGYYYKNEDEQDKIVSVPAMLQFFEAAGTPENLKKNVPFPNVGDHVLTSRLKSQDLDDVREKTFQFAVEALGLTPVNTQ